MVDVSEKVHGGWRNLGHAAYIFTHRYILRVAREEDSN